MVKTLQIQFDGLQLTTDADEQEEPADLNDKRYLDVKDFE